MAEEYTDPIANLLQIIQSFPPASDDRTQFALTDQTLWAWYLACKEAQDQLHAIALNSKNTEGIKQLLTFIEQLPERSEETRRFSISKKFAWNWYTTSKRAEPELRALCVKVSDG